MKNAFRTSLLAGLVAASGFAQDAAKPPISFKIQEITTFADWRAYAGGKSFGWGFELGYDFSTPGDVAGIAVYAGYVRSIGDLRKEIYQTPTGSFAPIGTGFNLMGWRLGGDIRFETPIKGLTPYIGLGLVYWKGERMGDSPIFGPKGPILESNAKFAGRVGVEYQITKSWGVSADYNYSEWRANSRDTNMNGSKEASLKISGYNPMNPSWMAISASYRFNWGK
ncbi:MAG: outer membrane beta-barrel protein [Acidobacteria bacterium]|nr:outer membrane beta-barrel protein [Acidobacteriota bacterium]